MFSFQSTTIEQPQPRYTSSMRSRHATSRVMNIDKNRSIIYSRLCQVLMNLFNRELDLGNPLSISCRSWIDAFYFTLVLSSIHMEQCGNMVLARVLLQPVSYLAPRFIFFGIWKTNTRGMTIESREIVLKL